MRALILLNLLTVCVFGAQKEFTLERSAIKMESEGIEFKPFKGMEATDIKPLKSETLIRNKAEEIEVYDYTSLWLRDQKLATFKNSQVKIEFYKLNYLPPNIKPFWKNYIREEDFQGAIATNTVWDTKSAVSWLKGFHKKDVKLENKFPNLTFNVKQAWVAYGQAFNSYDLLIVSRDKRLYYFHAQTTSDLTKDNVKALNELVKSIRINKAKNVLASNQSRNVKKVGKMTAKYETTVKRVIQEVGNTKGWWYAKTPNYILKSNLNSRGKTFAKKVQVRVELMRKKFEEFIPPEKAIDDISVIAIPNSREEYIKYAEAPNWSAGVWSPRRRELVVSPLQGTGSNRDEKQMMETLHHEAFHQYLHYALNKKVTPPWFNEGHADLFASVKVTGSKVTIIEYPYAVQALSKHFKNKSLNISRLLNSDYQQFYANKDINYPFAWSLVYFLRKAGPMYEAEGYDRIAGKLLDEMAVSGNMKLATKKAFEKIDMAQLQEDFYEFWNEKKLRARAARTKLITSKR